MVITVMVGASAFFGLVIAIAMLRWPGSGPATTAVATRAVGRELRRHHRLRVFVRSRLDPEELTGLALTIATACIALGGIVLGTLAYIIRSKAGVIDIDLKVASWAATHATSTSTAILRWITQIGSTPVVISAALVVGIVEYRRIRSRSLWLFLFLVIGGQLVIVNLIKLGVARARPSIDPLATFSGASFPSGHTAAAAACSAALALVLSRGRPPRIRAALTGGAVSIAVAVGCSRMFLGVHWFTDVAAGLAVGWAWFAVCAIATGGRLLRFGASAEAAIADASLGPARDGEARADDLVAR